MEVTLDDLTEDLWTTGISPSNAKFQLASPAAYPSLHQHIPVVNRDWMLCELHSDGSAGAPEPHDGRDRDTGREQDEWHGSVGGFTEWTENKTSAGAQINAHKGSIRVKGSVGKDSEGAVSGRVDAEWKF